MIPARSLSYSLPLYSVSDVCYSYVLLLMYYYVLMCYSNDSHQEPFL